MKTAYQIAKELGRAEIAEVLGVGPTAVSNHVVKGVFPASWYLALSRLAETKGVNLPENVFDWRIAEETKTETFQEEPKKLPAVTQEMNCG